MWHRLTASGSLLQLFGNAGGQLTPMQLPSERIMKADGRDVQTGQTPAARRSQTHDIVWGGLGSILIHELLQSIGICHSRYFDLNPTLASRRNADVWPRRSPRPARTRTTAR
jgi:hypothetical protein